MKQLLALRSCANGAHAGKFDKAVSTAALAMAWLFSGNSQAISETPGEAPP